MYSFLRLVLPMCAVLFLWMPAVQAFDDVPADHPSRTALDRLVTLELISGYPDGSFQPHRTINRAEFIKLIVTTQDNMPEAFQEVACYEDVPHDAWFAREVCFAKAMEWIGDTPRFHPTAAINVAEMAKILTLAFRMPLASMEEDVEWYAPFLHTLSTQNAIPPSISHTGQEMRRIDGVEMLWRVLEEQTALPARPWEELRSGMCVYPVADTSIPNVDMERVRNAWMDWHNKERRALGLTPYIYNVQLDRSAHAWSATAKQRGYIDHKRPGTSAYYDYHAIRRWFTSQGVHFLGGGTPFTESIGWGTYSCSGDDCTDALIRSIQSTHQFFMSEKGKAYRPHYNAIASRSFKEIGLGIVIDPGKRRYYLTVHYGTQISGASSVCGL